MRKGWWLTSFFIATKSTKKYLLMLKSIKRRINSFHTEATEVTERGRGEKKRTSFSYLPYLRYLCVKNLIFAHIIHYSSRICEEMQNIRQEFVKKCKIFVQNL